MPPTFIERLTKAIRDKKTPLIVGIDPDEDKIPIEGKSGIEAVKQFCYVIIDIAADFVPAIKIQSAYFELYGPRGHEALLDLIIYAKYKNLLVIFDGKRGDIGHTAKVYAEAWMGNHGWAVDAITINPYTGEEGITPFVECATKYNRGVFALVRTSAIGGDTFQGLSISNGRPLYHVVGETIDDMNQKAKDYGVIGAVVGATYPAQLMNLRKAMSKTWFLVPGYGAQGGKSVKGAFDNKGLGAIINSSRDIIFAYRRKKYSEFGRSNWEMAMVKAIKDTMDDIALDISC